MRRLGCVAIMLTVLSGPVLAEEVDISLSPGEGIALPFYSSGPGCVRGGVNLIEIVEPPKHGTVRVAYEDFTPESGRCKGRKFRANVLRYQPKSGYRGTDVVEVRRGFNPDDSFRRIGWKPYTLRFVME